MTNKTRYYNVEEFNNQKKQQGKFLKAPPRANFLAAANHIRDLFENKKFAYGVMGNLEMLCLGHHREMSDLYFAFDDKDFVRIKLKLEADQRVRLPEGMNSLFPSKILVRTGPVYKDKGCQDSATIEVNLVPPGSHGTPPNSMLSDHLVLLSLNTDGKLKTYKGLSMLYLVKTMIYYCRVHDLAWDPRKDVIFLCQHYGKDVQLIRDQLDQKAVRQNLLGTSFFSRLSLEDQRRCYHILLGKEPPPAMAVIPPSVQAYYKHTHSAPAPARLPLTSHKSSPALSMQQPHEFSNPPLLMTSKLPPNWPTNKGPSTVEPSVSKLPAELSTVAKNSRSRYRPMNASDSCRSSPEEFSNLQPETVTVQSTSQQRSTSGPIAGTGRNFVLNLNGKPNDLVNFHVRTQPSFHSGKYPFQSSLQHQQAASIELLATPAPYNPGQQYIKSQIGLGDQSIIRSSLAQRIPITNNPVPPQARGTFHRSRYIQLEDSRISMPGIQKVRPHVVNPERVAVPPQHSIAELDASTNQPNLVGPTEMHRTAQELSRPSEQLLVATTTAPRPFSFVFEMDAMSQERNIIAELSADIDAALQKAEEDRSHTQELRLELLQSREHQAEATNSPLQLREPNKSSYFHPQLTPMATIPMSLVAGGSGLRPQSDTLSSSFSNTQTQSASVQLPVTGTNASKYSGYYSPPSSASHSHQTSPQLTPAPQSAYKAYNPSNTPLTPPATQPSADQISQRQTCTSFGGLRDVDGAGGYFRTHKRDASHDSHTSNASHDSAKLAQEYRAELPEYGHGYAFGGKGREVSETRGRRGSVDFGA